MHGELLYIDGSHFIVFFFFDKSNLPVLFWYLLVILKLCTSNVVTLNNINIYNIHILLSIYLWTRRKYNHSNQLVPQMVNIESIMNWKLKENVSLQLHRLNNNSISFAYLRIKHQSSNMCWPRNSYTSTHSWYQFSSYAKSWTSERGFQKSKIKSKNEKFEHVFYTFR